MLPATPSEPLSPPSSSPFSISYLYFLLAALKKLPKEAECSVYRSVGPDAIQAVFTPACVQTFSQHLHQSLHQSLRWLPAALTDVTGAEIPGQKTAIATLGEETLYGAVP